MAYTWDMAKIILFFSHNLELAFLSYGIQTVIPLIILSYCDRAYITSYIEIIFRRIEKDVTLWNENIFLLNIINAEKLVHNIFAAKKTFF
jgi:hypothetical protein